MTTRKKKEGNDLGSFAGHDVVKSTVAITNAGDGLSKALGVDPTVLDIGDKVFVVLECEVAKIGFAPVDRDTDVLTRIHTLRAGTATLVDEDLVREHLDDQAKRIEEAAGVHRLPMGEDGEVDDEGEPDDG